MDMWSYNQEGPLNVQGFFTNKWFLIGCQPINQVSLHFFQKSMAIVFNFAEFIKSDKEVGMFSKN